MIWSMGYNKSVSKLVNDKKWLTVFALALFLLSLWPTRPTWNNLSVVLSIALISGLTAWLLSRRFSPRLLSMVILAVLILQAQWGIAQFVLQRDLGLYLIGESRLSVDIDGVAKFAFGDGKLIRAYGPFEHANSLAGSLVLGVMFCALLAKGIKPGERVSHYYAMAYVLLIGIIVSFSRSAYLAAALIIIFLIPFGLRRVWRAFFLILLITVIVFLPLFMARFHDAEDRAYVERLSGVRYALSLVRERSIWSGVGQDYRKALRDYLVRHNISFEPWQIDYVHVVPLLLIAQIGVGPAVLLFGILLFITLRYYRRKWVWLLPLVVLLLFDHYMLTQVPMLALTLVTYTLMPRFLS